MLILFHLVKPHSAKLILRFHCSRVCAAYYIGKGVGLGIQLGAGFGPVAGRISV